MLHYRPSISPLCDVSWSNCDPTVHQGEVAPAPPLPSGCLRFGSYHESDGMQWWAISAAVRRVFLVAHLHFFFPSKKLCAPPCRRSEENKTGERIAHMIGLRLTNLIVVFFSIRSRFNGNIILLFICRIDWKINMLVSCTRRCNLIKMRMFT